MGKPYNAGIAAANGVECAKLAALGMTSADDGLLGSQGFLATHTPGIDTLETGARFLFEDNKYKLHACCHGTHAMIEALLAAGVSQGYVQSLHVHTNPRWLKVCDLKTPRTGLEAKFSYAWLAGMVLRGDATQDEANYSDALATDANLAGFAERVTVYGDSSLTDMQVACLLTLKDGRSLNMTYDLAEPIPNDVLAIKLKTKADALIGDKALKVWAFQDLEGKTAKDIGEVIRAP
jgi:2-methylcitrate dehydratase PrpD